MREPGDAHLRQLLTAYGFRPGARLERLQGGLINDTYVARDPAGTPLAVVQRLHRIFGARVNEDIDAVTQHLAASGLATPRLVRTTTGDRWVELEGDCWRALSYVDGSTTHTIESRSRAESAGALVGAFHRALASFEYDYVHVRANVHDTTAHLAKLRERCDEPRDAGDYTAEARALGAAILAAVASAPALPALPPRHVHGDLKISNVMFDRADAARAICLVDLDTVGRQSIAYELGDALRSWANPAGESTETPAIELDIVDAAFAGYATTARGLLLPSEVGAIISGLEVVCLELAARFCVDVFDDSYFGWDATRFGSRRHHNLVRARGQLALALSVAEQRDRLHTLAQQLT